MMTYAEMRKFSDYLEITEKLRDDAPKEALEAFEKFKKWEKNPIDDEGPALLDLFEDYYVKIKRLSDDAPEEAVEAFEKYENARKKGWDL